MTYELKPVHLTAELLSQVRGLLRRGRSLSNAVSRALDAETAYVVVPEDYDPSRIGPLDVGGVCSQKESGDLLVEAVLRHLDESSDNLVIFEDPLAHPGDEFLRRVGSNWGWYQDEVYYFLADARHNRGEVESVLRRAKNPVHFLGVLTKRAGGLPEQPFLFGPDTFRALVENARHALVGVFDQESFMKLSLRGLSE